MTLDCFILLPRGTNHAHPEMVATVIPNDDHKILSYTFAGLIVATSTRGKQILEKCSGITVTRQFPHLVYMPFQVTEGELNRAIEKKSYRFVDAQKKIIAVANKRCVEILSQKHNLTPFYSLE